MLFQLQTEPNRTKTGDEREKNIDLNICCINKARKYDYTQKIGISGRATIFGSGSRYGWFNI